MGARFLHLWVAAWGVPPCFEYVGDEGGGVECGDEHGSQAHHPRIAACRCQLALAEQEHRRTVEYPVT